VMIDVRKPIRSLRCSLVRVSVISDADLSPVAQTA
jgi:hypothetical protein